jgi:hypothetical protein
MNALCDQAFSGSHICHSVEYDLATSASPVPTEGAWIDYSVYIDGTGIHLNFTVSAATPMGRYISSDNTGNCANWNQLSYSSPPTDTKGLLVTATGTKTDVCKNAHPVACCSTRFKEKFRGFSSPLQGNPGGRAMMHYACASQFPGSHLCHLAEYVRAGSTTSPPASGVWLDFSTYVDGTGTHLNFGVAATSQMGRYVSSDNTGNCANWSQLTYSGNADTKAYVLSPTGYAPDVCKTARAAACCE